MKKNELYIATLRNGKHLKVAKTISPFSWSFPERKGENIPVIMSRYVNGKLVAKREVEYDFMTLPFMAHTWNRFLQEAELYERLGGRDAYITYKKLPDFWRKAA